MTLLNPGYWPDTYWPADYWQTGEQYWPEAGAPATGIVSLSLFPRSLALTLESGRITLTVGDRDFSLTLPSIRT